MSMIQLLILYYAYVLGIGIKFVNVQRLDEPSNNCRPINVSLLSDSDVYNILGCTRKFKSNQIFNDIKVTSDKTCSILNNSKNSSISNTIIVFPVVKKICQ